MDEHKGMLHAEKLSLQPFYVSLNGITQNSRVLFTERFGMLRDLGPDSSMQQTRVKR